MRRSHVSSLRQSPNWSRFDELFDEAVPRVLEQRHVRDVVPRAGGRWPLSAALLPDPSQGRRLTEVMERLLPMAGPHHFCTGSAAALHLTVRALEHRRDGIGPDDLAAHRYLSAISRTARRSAPLQFRVTGLTLTTTGVMAALQPADGEADRLAALLAEELGPDSWYEANLQRTIWYATLLHFAAPIVEPADLVAFVADRRHLNLGHININRLSLVRFDYRTETEAIGYMQPQDLGPAPLSRMHG